MGGEGEGKVTDERKEKWDKTAFTCPASGVKHSLIPISWAGTQGSNQVTELLCTNCYQRLDMSDIQNYGWSKK